MSGPWASVVEGFPQSRSLRGCASRLESPENESRLRTQGARARRRAKARVRPKPAPGVHDEVDVPLYGGGVDLRDISGVHRSALIDHIGDRRQEAIDITLDGDDLRLIAVATGECACAAEHDCECAARHERESLAVEPIAQHERRGAVQEAADCYIRPSPGLTAGAPSHRNLRTSEADGRTPAVALTRFFFFHSRERCVMQGCARTCRWRMLVALFVTAVALLLVPAGTATAFNPIVPTKSGETITLNGKRLTIEQLVDVARFRAQVRLAPAARQRSETLTNCCSRGHARTSGSTSSTGGNWFRPGNADPLG